jgi:hypothetical protein
MAYIPGPIIRVKGITLIPGQITTLNTPMIVLPAPPAGKAHNILGISHRVIFNANPYTGASSLYYGVYIATWNIGFPMIFIDGNALPATANYNAPAGMPSVIDDTISLFQPGVFSTVDDFYVQSNGIPTGGDSDIQILISYEIVDLIL